jgi:hypothetical protein
MQNGQVRLGFRGRIGVSGAQLRRIAVHRATGFYRNSKTTIYKNKLNN